MISVKGASTGGSRADRVWAGFFSDALGCFSIPKGCYCVEHGQYEVAYCSYIGILETTQVVGSI